MKTLNLIFFKRVVVVFFLFLGMNSTNSMVSYDKYWSVAIITGSLSPNKPAFKYYFEPQLRLIDERYVFNQLLLLGGLGYQFHPNIVLFGGPGFTLLKTVQGTPIHEERLWEQLNWLLLNTPYLNINSRTRLEERKRSQVAPIAIQLRERIWVKIPFKHWDGYALSLFNEFFFNLNQPQWISPYFFEQNRTFIGISSQLAKPIVMDVGYLNQYIRSIKKELNRALLLSFTVSW